MRLAWGLGFRVAEQCLGSKGLGCRWSCLGARALLDIVCSLLLT